MRGMRMTRLAQPTGGMRTRGAIPLDYGACGPYGPFHQAADPNEFNDLPHTPAYLPANTPAHWSFR